MIEVVSHTPALADRVARLFEEAACPCHCHYWHFEGTKNEWLDRCANAPEANRTAEEDRLRRGAPGTGGLVALGERDGAALGWMKLAPRAALPKLSALPVYRRRANAGGDDAAWAIGCFLVHPAARRTGVASALLDAAEAHVRARGGRAIEAYPRRSSERLYDEELWMGPESLFVSRGYVEVDGEAPYPVLRREL